MTALLLPPIVSGLLLLGATPPTPSTTEQGSAVVAKDSKQYRPVRVVVSLDLGDDDPDTRAAIQEAAERALARNGVQVDPDSGLAVYVELQWSRQGVQSFVTTLRVRDGAGSEAEEIQRFDCPGCAAGELLELLDAELSEHVVPRLERVEAQPTALEAAAQSAPTQADPPPPRPPRGEGLVLAGTMTLSIGAAATVGVAATIIAEPFYDYDPGATEWALLGASIGTAAVGATLLGVGLRLRRSRSRSARVLPYPGGVAIAGRF